MSTNEGGKSMEFANALKQSEAVRISSLESEVRRLRSAHVLATSLATGSLIATMAIIVSYAVSAIGDPSDAAFDQVHLGAMLYCLCKRVGTLLQVRGVRAGRVFLWDSDDSLSQFANPLTCVTARSHPLT